MYPITGRGPASNGTSGLVGPLFEYIRNNEAENHAISDSIAVSRRRARRHRYRASPAFGRGRQGDVCDHGAHGHRIARNAAAGKIRFRNRAVTYRNPCFVPADREEAPRAVRDSPASQAGQIATREDLNPHLLTKTACRTLRRELSARTAPVLVFISYL